MKAKIWVCPFEDCGNYYASSSQAHLDLTQEENLQGDLTHTQTRWREVVGHRSDCPDCKQRGRGHVARVPVMVEITKAHGKASAAA